MFRVLVLLLCHIPPETQYLSTTIFVLLLSLQVGQDFAGSAYLCSIRHKKQGWLEAGRGVESLEGLATGGSC